MVSSFQSSFNKRVSSLFLLNSTTSYQPIDYVVNLTLFLIVVVGEYTYDKGYKHLASGLCCGLSSLVSNIPKLSNFDYRLPVSLLVSLVMQESEQMPNKNRSSSV